MRTAPSSLVRYLPSTRRPPTALSMLLTRGRTVLSARWGLSILRQWAADDSVFKALESPTPSEEDERKICGRLNPVNVNEARVSPRQLCNCKSSKGRSSQAPARRRKPGRGAEEGVAATAASTEDFGSEGCLRLSSPAGESALSLAWTNSRDVEFSIHLFTPGAVEQ